MGELDRLGQGRCVEGMEGTRGDTESSEGLLVHRHYISVWKLGIQATQR
jgi:hypothetical protein